MPKPASHAPVTKYRGTNNMPTKSNRAILPPAASVLKIATAAITPIGDAMAHAPAASQAVFSHSRATRGSAYQSDASPSARAATIIVNLQADAGLSLDAVRLDR